MKVTANWPFLLARMVAAALCFAAVAKQPYNFYVLTRWAVFCVCVWGVWLEARRSASAAMFLFVAVGILFNPLRSFHFARETWKWLDIVAGLLLLASLAFSPPRENN